MPKLADYQLRRDGAWRLAVLPARWSDDLQRNVLSRVQRAFPSKHPQTMPLDVAGPAGTDQCFLKVFHRISIGDAVKDLFRPSKSARFLRQGLALAGAGFTVPVTIGAGEVRRLGFFHRGFVLTVRVEGTALPEFFADLIHQRDGAQALITKRRVLKRLAQLVRKFHRLGFVHGDLIASNLFVTLAPNGEPIFYFMDNDRTRHLPSRLPHSLWKRNLVQLNRMPLPGITLQDRLRFFCEYLDRTRLSQADRRLARWLERKTRQRRHECDGADPTASFRKLMSWDPR